MDIHKIIQRETTFWKPGNALSDKELEFLVARARDIRKMTTEATCIFEGISYNVLSLNSTIQIAERHLEARQLAKL